MPHRRGYGLPRRFAPRNDMQKPAACPREQLRAAMANLLRFPYSPEALLSATPHRRGYGLPRRFAPRNDMLKTGA